MTPELTVLGLAAILQAVQIALAAWSLNRDGLSDWNASPRDSDPPFSIMTGRLRRAVDNHFEALVFFTIAVLLVVLGDATSGFTALCAWTYLAARILYVPAYAFGWVPWRSLIYAVGMLASFAMILNALLL